ncbi:MAG: sulfatase [Actinomycetota bacterium]
MFVALFLPACAPSPDRPHIVVILTDDQSADSLPHTPPAMPYLQGRMEDPSDHWIQFTNAYVNTPLCCPSRASILSGQYSHHTGVRFNPAGHLFDSSSTMATWLQGAGYHTGFFGKYLNRYPFGLEPFVPAGWDRWIARAHGGLLSLYYNYTLIEDGRAVQYGGAPSDYITDVLADKAVQFIESAPADRPFLLYFSPTAPHAPWVPSPLHENEVNRFTNDLPSPAFNERGSLDRPLWVTSRRELSSRMEKRLVEERARQFSSLLGVDDAIRTIVTALERRGELDNTVIVFLSDNGYSFGEHRWIGKRCAYDVCTKTPLVVRFPGQQSARIHETVSNVDIAPTLAQLAGVIPTTEVDGESLVPLIEGKTSERKPGELIEWVGDVNVPAYWAIRTEDFLYVELATGERELYDVGGLLGPADPFELDNRASTLRYFPVQILLAVQLAELRGGPSTFVTSESGLG